MARVDPEVVEQAWQTLQSNWDDDQAHRRFLELSRLAGDLQGAGRRYRQVCEGDPERAGMAAAQIDRLLTLAMQDMHILRAPRRKPTRVWLWLATAVLGGLLMLLARALLQSR